MLPKHRPPTHPGEMLSEEFLKPMGITQAQFAEHIGCTRAALNELINGKRGLSPEMACKIADAFGTSVQLWMGLQTDYDLWHALKKHKRIPFFKAS